MKEREAKGDELRLDWAAACKGACGELFAGVSPKALSRLEEALLPIRYREDELIFQEGAYAAGIYIVSQGLVQCGRHAGGRRHILKLVGPGEMIGLESLFMEGQPTRLGYAKALTDTVVAFIERDLILELFPKEPSLALNLCRRLTREVLFLEYKLTRSVCRTIEENVALLLLSLGRKYGIKEEGGLYIGVELKRSTMADILGISLESLMRVLRKLRERGIISFEGRRIIIRDEERLEGLVEPPMPLPIELSHREA
jgi:CRP/FNR family transcriptional regulator